MEALPKIESGELKPEKQDDSLTCYAPRLTKAMGQIDWEKDAVSIERLIRGLNSWPSAYTYYRGKTLKNMGKRMRLRKAAAKGRATRQNPGQYCKCGEGFL